MDVLTFAVLGLGEGALIAAVGLAVVLTFRGSGVVNFATGAMASYAAYIYTDLRTKGQLFIPPLPFVPKSINVGVLSLWPAVALTLALTAAYGVLFHLLIFRPLRAAPPLAKVVASIGLMLALQAITVLRFGSNVLPDPPPILPESTFTLFGTRMPWDRVILAGLVAAAGLVCWILFRFTRVGLAMRATAENEKGALLLGFAPDRQALLNWVLGSVVAAAIGILLRGILPLDPTSLTLVIVPALAAALVGNFTSFGITIAAGLAIGALRQEVTFFQTKSWFPSSGGLPIPGVREALPFVVIVIFMFVRGRALPERGAVVAGRLPSAPRPTAVPWRAGIGVMVAAIGLLTLGYQWREAIINSTVGAVLTLSLVVLTGFLGQISLMQLAVSGIAGFTLSRLAYEHGIPFPFGALLAAAVATLVGLLLAIPALRVRGVNLAVVTLAASVAIEQLVFSNESISKGEAGAKVNAPALFGLKFGPSNSFIFGDAQSPTPGFGLFALLILTLLGLGVVNLRRSGTGRRLLAVRSNERAAAAAGLDVRAAKLIGFGIAAFIAGTGGVLTGYKLGTLDVSSFATFASISLFAFAYLGGITSVTGAVIGGLLVSQGVGAYILDTYIGIGGQYTLLIAGIGLILTAVLNPEGIAGAFRLSTSRLMAHRARSRHGARPTTVAAEQA